jgi:peroxiredoxin
MNEQANTPALAVNDKVPQVVFKTRVRDESVGGDNPFVWKDVTTEEIFDGRRVAIFSLPGAFTPTCSSTHLPGFESKYDELRAKGVDEVYCISVNDAFSMFQWAKQLQVQKVQMLPDGNGEFSRKMGMLVKKENLGFGERSWRYSMLVDNGVITLLNAEAGRVDNCETDPFERSDVNTLLSQIDQLAASAA